MNARVFARWVSYAAWRRRFCREGAHVCGSNGGALYPLKRAGVAIREEQGRALPGTPLRVIDGKG